MLHLTTSVEATASSASASAALAALKRSVRALLDTSICTDAVPAPAEDAAAGADDGGPAAKAGAGVPKPLLYWCCFFSRKVPSAEAEAAACSRLPANVHVASEGHWDALDVDGAVTACPRPRPRPPRARALWPAAIRAPARVPGAAAQLSSARRVAVIERLKD